MSGLRFGSVCSGIEAASVAFSPLGWKAAWFSEIEPFACKVLAHRHPTVPNLGDMTKLPERIASGEVEAPDVLCGGTPCFTAGHLVLTEKGYTPIELIRVGDLVVTHLGRLRPVVRVGSKLAEVGSLTGVGMLEPIRCTPDHPFLSSKWHMQSTRRDGKYARVEHCGEPEWVPAKELAGRQWCQLTTYEQQPQTVRSSKFSPEVAMYVAGMYVGDGWIRKYPDQSKKSVLLGINPDKYQKLKSAIGDTVHTVSQERTTVRVAIHDTEFAEWLEENFAHYSHLKNIPSWVLGHGLRSEFLRGFLDTDGCRLGNGKISISTTSRQLAYGVSDLLSAEGYVPSVAFVATPATCVIEGRVVNQRDYYQVRAYPQGISRKSRVRHGMVLRGVSGYTPSGHERVFNIEVSEDHSYVVQGAVVHNCQAFSVAGLRKSLGDARGNLTLTFVEIANAIDAKRRDSDQPPAIVVWENVCGVLNTSDNAFGCLLAGLAGEDEALEPAGGKWSNAGCVFGPERAVAWRVLDAQHFGVPQRRKRVILVACPLERAHPTSILFEFEGVRRDTAPSRPEGESVTPCVTSGVANGGPGHGARSGSAKDGLIIPQPFELANCLTQRMHKGINTTLDEGHTPVLAFPANLSGTQHVGENAMPSLMAENPTAIAYSTKLHNTKSNQAGKLYEEYTTGLERSSPPPALLTPLQVRKLMPVECERLQGFPGGHTDIPGASDTARYKALGNSWAVPVFEWLGRRIDNALLERQQ